MEPAASVSRNDPELDKANKAPVMKRSIKSNFSILICIRKRSYFHALP